MEKRLLVLYELDSDDDVLVEITDVQISLNLEADKEELF